jgi:hypothetical protein
MVFRYPGKNQIPWLLVALALMFTSAYSIARLFADAAMIGGWTGLLEHAAELPRIQAEAARWELLAIALPFFAAVVIGFGKATLAISVRGPQASLTYPAESPTEKWTAPIVRYLVRLVVSVLGTFGFLLSLLLVGLVLYKLRIHVH